MTLENLRKEKLSGVLEEFGVSVKSYILENYKEFIEEFDVPLVKEVITEMSETYGKTYYTYADNNRRVEKDTVNTWGPSLYYTGEKCTLDNITFTDGTTFLDSIFFIKDYNKYIEYLLKEEKQRKEEAISAFIEREEEKIKEREVFLYECVRLNILDLNKEALNKALKEERLEKANLKKEDVEMSLSISQEIKSIIEDKIDNAIYDHEYNSH